MKHIKTIGILIALTAAACSRAGDRNADTVAALSDTSAMMGSASADTVGASASSGAVSTTGGRMNPNSASGAELAAVPGITADLASAIVANRPYSDNVGVDRVLPKSLSEQQRDSVYAHLWIPLDLNKASGDEILLIPGVGTRMRREFLEYRPYTSIEQFRREIGKYVDKNEVARLESYVKI
jgi:DNA uptake protein ComE-like DNA-binding protein